MNVKKKDLSANLQAIWIIIIGDPNSRTLDSTVVVLLNVFIYQESTYSNHQ